MGIGGGGGGGIAAGMSGGTGGAGGFSSPPFGMTMTLTLVPFLPLSPLPGILRPGRPRLGFVGLPEADRPSARAGLPPLFTAPPVAYPLG